MSSPSSLEVRHAYRHLYKALLRAVQYSKPARFVARDRVRNAFRSVPSSSSTARPAASAPAAGATTAAIVPFDRTRIQRTLEFLEAAARARGLEHRIVKNLMLVWWWRQMNAPLVTSRAEQIAFRNVAYEEFDRTIEKLNETRGLCIR